jgi:hypothetical protein
VSSFAVWPGISELVDVQLHPSAIAQTVGDVIARRGFYLGAKFEAGHADQGLFEHVRLELTLVVEVDVTEFGTAGTALASGLPEVFDSMFAWFEHLGGFGSAKRAAAVFKNSRLDLFARQGVRDKHHATLVASHKDAAVRHLFDRKGQFLA